MQVNELRSLLSRYHIRPDKKLGQNFLLSEKVLDQIVAAADVTNKDTVLEVGPGLGFLTGRLAEKAREVIAVEKDGKLCRALNKMYRNRGNVQIVCEDILQFLTKKQKNQKTEKQGQEFLGSSVFPFFRRPKVVANIPYYLTGKILQTFLQPATQRPSLMVLLLQKEVAERIAAKPGRMSLLSVSVQFYADPEIIDLVPRTNFYPIPEVDSAIVKLKVLEIPRLPVDEKIFFRTVKLGFSNRRKQLQNNLGSLVLATKKQKDQKTEKQEREFLGSSVFPFFRPKDLLNSLGINPLARAQDLSLEDWKKLYDKIFMETH